MTRPDIWRAAPDVSVGVRLQIAFEITGRDEEVYHSCPASDCADHVDLMTPITQLSLFSQCVRSFWGHRDRLLLWPLLLPVLSVKPSQNDGNLGCVCWHFLSSLLCKRCTHKLTHTIPLWLCASCIFSVQLWSGAGADSCLWFSSVSVAVMVWSLVKSRAAASFLLWGDRTLRSLQSPWHLQSSHLFIPLVLLLISIHVHSVLMDQVLVSNDSPYCNEGQFNFSVATRTFPSHPGKWRKSRKIKIIRKDTQKDIINSLYIVVRFIMSCF